MKTRILAFFVLIVGALFAVHLHTAQASCDPSLLGPAAYGQSGATVSALQSCLINAGYAIPAGVTGYYGEQTRVAVQRFYAQELALPTWDGRSMGPQGRSTLSARGGTAQHPVSKPVATHAPACDASQVGTAQYGTNNAGVVALQQCLLSAGYALPAGATGYYGEQTRSAVRAFYADHMSMPDWHGDNVGPLGRSVLAARSVRQGTTTTGLRRAESASDLVKYLDEPRDYGLQGRFANGLSVDEDLAVPTMAADSGTVRAESAGASRVSTTNVQIAGIDEPDIVKTDGEHIFLSTGEHWYRWIEPMPAVTDSGESTDMIMPRYSEPDPTRIVDALPAESMAVVSEAIKERGEMLLVQDANVLVVFAQSDIIGYDVSDAAKPKEVWRMGIAENTAITTGRLLDDTVYLVTETWISRDRPCPLPIITGEHGVTVACTDIWLPSRIEPVSHTYTLMAVDPKTGTANKKLSVAGESGNTVVSMSLDNLYIATPVYSSQYEILATLMIEVMAPYLPSSTISRARTILTYDISESGKLREVEQVLQDALATLDADERLRIENEAANKYQELMRARVRDMYKTRISRVDLDTFSVAATGEVPGHLLNQFALDEYQGNVRVAVTVDDGWRGTDSMNDVYVLDPALAVVGKIQDLGLTERIYSVRFVGEVGYLVTFRQIDPFYVLDLAIPTQPKVVGELKIPGYSAYLEPLGNDLILGVGREGSGVKLSVFDVSNPSAPTEKSKYLLKDSWTEVESNHHAFLRDPDHEVFFIPGGEGGYIFSYADGELSLKKALAGYNVKRALYIDDIMYIVSTDAIRALDESSWKEIGELKF